MKYIFEANIDRNGMSHPVRGAWIEIECCQPTRFHFSSHPVRGAWIEIKISGPKELHLRVAPREGCVD